MESDINSKLDLNNVPKNNEASIDISGYTSVEDPYICPCDGYVRVSTAGDYIAFKTRSGQMRICSSGGEYSASFVRKGARIIAVGNSAKFIKLNEQLE